MVRSPEPVLAPPRQQSDGEDSSSSSGIGENEYIVESLLARRWKNGGYEYKVAWKGYDAEDEQTWEPESNLNCPEVLAAFLAKNPESHDKKRPRPSLTPSTGVNVPPRNPNDSSADERPAAKVSKTQPKKKLYSSKEARRLLKGSSSSKKTKDGSRLADKFVKSSSQGGGAAGGPGPSNNGASLISKGTGKAPENKFKTPIVRDTTEARASSSGISLVTAPRPMVVPKPPLPDFKKYPPAPVPSVVPKPPLPTFKKRPPAPVPDVVIKHEPMSEDDLFSEDDGKGGGRIPGGKVDKGKGKEVTSVAPTPVPQHSVAVIVASTSTATLLSHDASDIRAQIRDTGIQGPFSIFQQRTTPRTSLAAQTCSSPPRTVDPRTKPKTARPIMKGGESGSGSGNAASTTENGEGVGKVEEKGKKINSSEELERKLRKTAFYAMHKKVFEGKEGKHIAVACAEVLRVPVNLLLSLKGRRCAITTAALGKHGSSHDAENFALGILLLKVGAELPRSVADIEIVFMHRKHSFLQLASSLIDLTTRSGPYVQFYEFGEGQSVASLLPGGYAVIPTLSALQNPAEVQEMLALKIKHSGLKIALHPATYSLAKSKGITSLTDYVSGLISRGDISVIAREDLPPDSAWAKFEKNVVLENVGMPVVSIESEFNEIERTLYHLRETKKKDRWRHMVIVSDRMVEGLKERCCKQGIRMMVWRGLKEAVLESLF